MGLLDKLLGRSKDVADKAQEISAEHGDTITEGAHKAADAVDDKTGGKYSGTIDKVEDAAEKAVDKLDGDEKPSASTQPPQAPSA